MNHSMTACMSYFNDTLNFVFFVLDFSSFTEIMEPLLIHSYKCLLIHIINLAVLGRSLTLVHR